MGDCASMVLIGSWVRLVHGSWVFFFFFFPWIVADLVDLVHGFFLAVGCGLWGFFCLAVVGGCSLRSGGRGRLLGYGYCGMWLWLMGQWWR